MTKDNFTSIVAIVDRSSSMAPLAKETIKGFNEFLAAQQKEPGEAIFTLATFAHDYKLVYDGVKLTDVSLLDDTSYRPAGYTALLDAIGITVNAHGLKLATMKEEERPSKVLVLIMTDGEENRSREFKHAHVQEIIGHQRDKYSWEFVFIGANQDAITAGASIGIAATNSYNFTADAAGSASLFENVTKGVSSYRSATIGSSYVMDAPTMGGAGAVPFNPFVGGVVTLGGNVPVPPVVIPDPTVKTKK